MEGYYNNGSSSYNTAQSFNSICAVNGLDQMASSHQVYVSASTPGLPPDTFRRQNSFSSSRFMEPLSQGKQFLKGLGSMFSSIGMVSKIVAFFYPPAAVVSSVAELASPVMVSLAGDTTPKPVVFKTEEKYNPWLR